MFYYFEELKVTFNFSSTAQVIPKLSGRVISPPPHQKKKGLFWGGMFF